MQNREVAAGCRPHSEFVPQIIVFAPGVRDIFQEVEKAQLVQMLCRQIVRMYLSEYLFFPDRVYDMDVFVGGQAEGFCRFPVVDITGFGFQVAQYGYGIFEPGIAPGYLYVFVGRSGGLFLPGKVLPVQFGAQTV